VRVLIDGTGKVLSVGEADPGWAVPAGGQVVDTSRGFGEFLTADTQAAGAAQASEVAWQAGAFAVRAATLTAEQARRRQDVATVRAFIADGTLTDPTSVALRAALRLLAGRLDAL
jgi:hypothetical protein